MTEYTSKVAAARRTFGQEQVSVAVGTPAILDVRGCQGFAVILNGGTATYQACNVDGDVVPGSSSAAVTGGALVQAAWTHYKITATTAAAIAAVIG